MVQLEQLNWKSVQYACPLLDIMAEPALQEQMFPLVFTRMRK